MEIKFGSIIQCTLCNKTYTKTHNLGFSVLCYCHIIMKKSRSKVVCRLFFYTADPPPPIKFHFFIQKLHVNTEFP